MMNTEGKNTNPVSPLALTHRQLHDWQTLRQDLLDDHAPQDQIDYCDAQIERLFTEIGNLQTPPAQ